MDAMRDMIAGKTIVQNYDDHYRGFMGAEQWQRESLVLDVNTAGVMLQVQKEAVNAIGLRNGDVYFVNWTDLRFKLKK